MQATTTLYEAIMEQAKQLSPQEKIELINLLLTEVKSEIEAKSPRPPHEPLLGLWKNVDISEDDIAEARREMWGNFPREDV